MFLRLEQRDGFGHISVKEGRLCTNFRQRGMPVETGVLKFLPIAGTSFPYAGLVFRMVRSHVGNPLSASSKRR